MNASHEELEAACRYGDRIVRKVETRVDISSLQACRAKLRRLSASIEDGGESRSDMLHSCWKAMSFLEDSLSAGVVRLMRGR